jgi:hypothetical protein
MSLELDVRNVPGHSEPAAPLVSAASPALRDSNAFKKVLDVPLS